MGIAKSILEKIFFPLYIIDKIKGGDEDEEDEGDSGGLLDKARGSNETEIKFKAYPDVNGSWSDESRELLYDRIDGTVTFADTGTGEEDEEERSDDDISGYWLAEADGGIVFEVEYNPVEGGHVIEEGAEEKLEEAGVITPEKGAAGKAFSKISGVTSVVGSGSSGGSQGSGGSGGAGTGGSRGSRAQTSILTLLKYLLPVVILIGIAYAVMSGGLGAAGAIFNPAIILPLVAVLGALTVLLNLAGSSLRGFLSSHPALLITLALFGAAIWGVFAFAPDMVEQTPIPEYTEYLGMNTDLDTAVQTSGVASTVSTYQRAKARVFCLMKGPSCLRQWRANHTQKPGSNAVGEEYQLQIKDFNIGTGEKLDINQYNPEDPIPVSFQIYNPRHDLRGIPAHNVTYKIVVEKDTGFMEGQEVCNTGWIPVSGYNLPGGDDKFSGNDLYPGTAASQAHIKIEEGQFRDQNDGKAVVETDEELTLSNCDLLQPALGTPVDFDLHIRYDYYSQSSLKFKAMSVQYKRNTQGINIDEKVSDTADTPVKAGMSVVSPVLFDEDNMKPRPFSVEATVETGKERLRYKVNDILVHKSSLTQPERDTDGKIKDCDFKVDGNTLKPGGEIRKRVLRKDGWFDKSETPRAFGCSLELSEPETISRSGETLIMGVESNYTVDLWKPIGGFKVLNSQCSEKNCPLLVTKDFDESWGDSYNWSTTCGGIDSREGGMGGCTVLEGPNSIADWPTENELTKDDKKLERGETAYHLQEDIADDAGFTIVSGVEGSQAVGLEEDNYDKISGKDSKGYAIYSSSEDVAIVKVGKKICSKKDWNKEGGEGKLLALKKSDDC